jgi:hypothetical protein
VKGPTCLLLPVLLGQFLGAPSLISTQAATTAPPPVRLALDPMPAPRPALRYTFVHEMIDQTPGNAALAYQQVLRLLNQNEKWRTQSDQLQEWLKLPLEQLPVEAVEAVVAQHASSLNRLVLATRQERCDFEIPIRQDGVNALLPHLAELRGASRLLAVEIRLRIRQGRHAEAIERLKAGVTLARHTGNGATLIEGLVGVAIANLMFDRVEELVGQPGAPNLYWALADLPPCLLNLWQATRWERCFLYVHMPVLWTVRTRPVSATDLRQSVREFQKFGAGGMSVPWLSEEESATVVTTVGALVAYPKAVEYLRRQGRTPEEIAKLPVAEALATYLGESYAVQRDELFKWFALPYYEARDGLARAEAGLQESRKQDPIGSVLPGLLLPALTKAASRYAALERRVAFLRCVEAIRIYAASHDRRLPPSLGDIHDVPIPQDPMTGAAFVYRLDGATARLEGGPLPEPEARASNRYELTIRP